MVYRDLTLSLAGHAALVAALLAFSATRPPVRIAAVVRPVRLVTTLEIPRQTAAPARAGRPAAVAPPAPAPRPTERAPRPAAEPAPSRPAAAPARTVPPVAVPRIVIPTGAPAPAAAAKAAPRPPAAADTALRDRLARRLSAPPERNRLPEEPAAPRIASLPRSEAAAVPPAAAPVATAAAGAAAPGTVQPVGFFPHAWYLAVLKERVFSRWAPPSEFYAGAGSIAALVSFRIDRLGRISGAAVKESSGHARFDRSALAAIQGLGQVPALPEQYAEETLDVVIRFQNE